MRCLFGATCGAQEHVSDRLAFTAWAGSWGSGNSLLAVCNMGVSCSCTSALVVDHFSLLRGLCSQRGNICGVELRNWLIALIYGSRESQSQPTKTVLTHVDQAYRASSRYPRCPATHTSHIARTSPRMLVSDIPLVPSRLWLYYGTLRRVHLARMLFTVPRQHRQAICQRIILHVCT